MQTMILINNLWEALLLVLVDVLLVELDVLEFLDAQITSDFKSKPPAIEVAVISNCDSSCDFYQNFHRIRGDLGCDFTGALRFQIPWKP